MPWSKLGCPRVWESKHGHTGWPKLCRLRRAALCGHRARWHGEAWGDGRNDQGLTYSTHAYSDATHKHLSDGCVDGNR